MKVIWSREPVERKAADVKNTGGRTEKLIISLFLALLHRFTESFCTKSGKKSYITELK